MIFFRSIIYICALKIANMMIVGKKNSMVRVFAGSPWEIASVANLLKAAYINVFVDDHCSKDIRLSVPKESYTAAVRLIDSRNG